MTQEQTTPESKLGNFLSEGWRELGRKMDRSKLRGTIRRQEAERATALAALGERAWGQKVDLSAFAALRDRLSGLEAKAGELSETAGRLEKEKAALEAERKSEQEKFAARRKSVEDAKRPVDAALGAARSAKSATEQAIRQGESRLTAIAGKLPALERDIASLGAAPEQAQKFAAAQSERTKLAAEQGELGAKLAKARADLPGQVAEESRLAAESRKHAAEIAAIDAEQKAAIGHIDGELARVRQESQGAARQAGAVQKDRGSGFGELGLALYDAKVAAPELAEAVARVAAIDRERAHNESTLGASMAETQSLAGGTMAKFWSVVVGVPLILAALGFGIWQFLQRRAAPVAVAKPAPAAPAGSGCAFQAPPSHGEGVGIGTDCARTEGTFVEGRLHGKGKKSWPSGERIEGQFFAGYLYGPGVRVYRDGRRFEAEFSGGRPVGQGKLTMPDGTVYEGRFWGPTVVGWAVRRSPGGEVVAGDWREGPDGSIKPFGTMLRVKADKTREKVDASEIDPTVPKPPASAATPPQASDDKLY